jgi:hypothetical protein
MFVICLNQNKYRRIAQISLRILLEVILWGTFKLYSSEVIRNIVYFVNMILHIITCIQMFSLAYLLPKHLNYLDSQSFDFECSWWWLFQKFYIYVFNNVIFVNMTIVRPRGPLFVVSILYSSYEWDLYWCLVLWDCKSLGCTTTLASVPNEDSLLRKIVRKWFATTLQTSAIIQYILRFVCLRYNVLWSSLLVTADRGFFHACSGILLQ